MNETIYTNLLKLLWTKLNFLKLCNSSIVFNMIALIAENI